MKTAKFIFAGLFLLNLCLFTSCKEDDDNNGKPAENKKYAWITGECDTSGYGLILFTPDGGKTWTRQGTSSAALHNIDLSGIWALDENNIWACGTNNSIIRSNDGGKTWLRIQTENATHSDLSMISIYDNNIWICGDSGTVYQSEDAGNTWKMQNREWFFNASLQGIGAVNANKIFTVGQYHSSTRGFIAYTEDGGEHWDTLAPANNYNKWQWIGVASFNNTIVIYGAKAHYMLSTDGGNTWKNDSVPGASGGGGKADINDLVMLNEETWWGAFDMGNIFITQNGGKTWLKQDVPPTVGNSFLMGIDCWNKEEALVVGSGLPYTSPVLATDDGGFSSWTKSYETETSLWKVSVIRGN